MDLTRELALGSGCRGQIASLGEDLLGVGVGSGFDHVASMGQNGVRVKGLGTVPQLSPATVDIIDNTCLIKSYAFNNIESCILIKLFDVVFTELFDEQLTALILSLSSDNCHARGVIRENVVDYEQFHGFV